MRKAIMCFIGAMMILSLAACTPTTEKGKTGEVKETQAAGGVMEKTPDPNAPELDVVSIYTVSEDGSKLEGTMDAVEELNEKALVDLLIQYGVLAEGTEAVSFTTEGQAASKEVGPGVSADSSKSEYGVLELNQFPAEQQELKLQAVANTFIENMDVVYMTIKVNGEVVAENLALVDAGR